MTNLFHYFLILVPGAVWGASFIVTRLILPHMPPITIGFARTLISAIFLLTILSVMGGHMGLIIHTPPKIKNSAIGIVHVTTSSKIQTPNATPLIGIIYIVIDVVVAPNVWVK